MSLLPTVEDMHAAHVPSAALLSLSAAQSGVLSCRQVLELGGSNTMIRRFVRDARWHRIAAGVLATTAAPSWLGMVWAGLLLGGSSAVVGGPAAAHLHGIAEQPHQIDIWAPENSPRSREPWQFHRSHRAGRGEPARVSLEQAVLDLCAGGDVDDIAATLSNALSRRRSTSARLRLLVDTHPKLRHRALILSMLADVDAGAESALEVRYLRSVERAHGLPVGQRQVSVSSHTRTDVGYIEHMVLVELDGRLGHDGAGVWRDWQRDNHHAVSGHFTTLRYGWHDVVRRPCAIAAQVAETLKNNGWNGLPSRCRDCRSAYNF